MLDILPADMKTITLRIRKRGKYMAGTLTLPKDVIKRHDLEDGDDIVICYLCKADENPKSYKDDKNNGKE